MNQAYNLREALLDEKWDDFIQNSQNGTIFACSYYLIASQVNYKLYYCYKKEELRAAILIIESRDGKNAVLDDFIIYNGIMYNKPTNKQNYSQQLSEQFKLQDFIAQKLSTIYDNIELSLHPTVVDIRAFLWVNYGEESKKQYTPSIRYTSYINISDFKNYQKLEDISIYNKASVSRRQQIRYAIKKGYKTVTTEETQQFINFYEKTMNRQNIDVENKKLHAMKNLINKLLSKRVAKIYACYDELDEIASMAFFGWDNKRAYYIFGANDPAKRDGHSGTAVLWNAFEDLSQEGVVEIDLEGINSPYRGWFKLSFGGNIIPYYEVKLGA